MKEFHKNPIDSPRRYGIIVAQKNERKERKNVYEV